MMAPCTAHVLPGNVFVTCHGERDLGAGQQEWRFTYKTTDIGMDQVRDGVRLRATAASRHINRSMNSRPTLIWFTMPKSWRIHSAEFRPDGLYIVIGETV